MRQWLEIIITSEGLYEDLVADFEERKRKAEKEAVQLLLDKDERSALNKATEVKVLIDFLNKVKGERNELLSQQTFNQERK